MHHSSRFAHGCLTAAMLNCAAAGLAVAAEPVPSKPAKLPSASPLAEAEYGRRTDGFAEKMALLEAAWQRKDYRLARSLADSLRDTVVQTQVEEESPGTPLPPALAPASTPASHP